MAKHDVVGEGAAVDDRVGGVEDVGAVAGVERTSHQALLGVDELGGGGGELGRVECTPQGRVAVDLEKDATSWSARRVRTPRRRARSPGHRGRTHLGLLRHGPMVCHGCPPSSQPLSGARGGGRRGRVASDGVGGFTGAAYSLVSHVARDRDYDPQFALWYYLNPWMGLVLGIFVYIAVFILMNVGSLMVNGQTTGGSPVFVLTTFFFAWAAGFKHNIAFDLADTLLKKLIPAPDDEASATSDTTFTPPAHKSGPVQPRSNPDERHAY